MKPEENKMVVFRGDFSASLPFVLDIIISQKNARKVDVRLPGRRNSTSHGARPVHLMITTIKWTRTSRLSIKNSLSRKYAKRSYKRGASWGLAEGEPQLPYDYADGVKGNCLSKVCKVVNAALAGMCTE